MAVGFVGLGNMGSHMARNLLNKGNQVLAFDVKDAALNAAKNDGAQIASSPADVASKVKTCITMLPASPHVIEVYTGKNGLLSAAQSGSLFLDSSTIDLFVSRDMWFKCAEKGVDHMDTPVSQFKGVNSAKDGLLTFMIGGSESRFSEAKSVLQHMGINFIHCGEAGMGLAAKICNNMLLAISMVGVAEAMNLGIKLGMDKHLLTKIISVSSGQCWSIEKYNPCPGVLANVPSSTDYKCGFSATSMVKDLGLAQTLASATKSPTPLGSMTHQIYQMMCMNKYGGKDFASVLKFLQEDDSE